MPGDGPFPDWRPAPNIRDAPHLYELENQAFDPDERVLDAMRDLGDWQGRTLVDLGCGTGFWLARYAFEASRVLGIEPDPWLRERAGHRVRGVPGVEVRAGSAERLPLADGSVDVVHARFAYFFGEGAEVGLAEVQRVLTPGGVLVAVDNDHAVGEFADILRAGGAAFAGRDPALIDGWWAARGAERRAVLSEWRCRSHADLAAVLANEFRDGAAAAWLAAHPHRVQITYGFLLFAVRVPG